MKKNDYYTAGVTAAKDAVAGLADAQLLTDLMADRPYVLASAESMALCSAERQGVKKTTVTFFDAFRRTFTDAVAERRRALREAAKPVFWGGKLTDADLVGDDPVPWTLRSQMEEIKSSRRDIARGLESLIRDAQRTLARVEAQEASEAVTDKLYPLYDENLGQMGHRADAAVLRLRLQQEATRTMIGLAGMRLPTHEELVEKGLRAAAPAATDAV